jgi:hypothetical protein
MSSDGTSNATEAMAAEYTLGAGLTGDIMRDVDQEGPPNSERMS